MTDPTKMLMFELRRELKNRNIDSTGQKIVLVSRLQYTLDQERAQNENESVHEIENVHEIESVTEIDMDHSATDNAMNLTTNRNLNSNTNDLDENHIFENNEQSNAHSISGAKTNERIESDGATFENAENLSTNRDTVSNIGAPGNKVEYTLMPGDRLTSVVLYSHDEMQFYVKNKALKNGYVTYRCQHAGCSCKVYLNTAENICTYQLPYARHDHETKEKIYEERRFKNAVKTDCANPDILAAKSTKTSTVKTIFNQKLQEKE